MRSVRIPIKRFWESGYITRYFPKHLLRAGNVNRHLLMIATYFLFLLWPITSRADEIDGRGALWEEAKSLLSRHDIAALDHAANEFRADRARLPDGDWKLAALYNGLKAAVPAHPDDPAWADDEHITQQWQADHPDSPAAVVIAATILSEHAWSYRGVTSYSEIPRENLALLAEYAERTRKFLDDHREVGQIDPAWYSLRIGLTRLEGADKDDVLELVRQAQAREPHYYSTQQIAFFCFIPKWGGSQRLVQRYLELVARSASEGEGDQSYGRIYFNFSLFGNDMRREFDQAGFDWPRFKASLREISVAYPDPRNLNVERAMACAFGQPSDYREAVRRLVGPKISVGPFDTPQWQADCEDWGLHGKVFDQPKPARVFSFVPLIGHLGTPLVLAILVTLGFAIATLAQRLMPQVVSKPMPIEPSGSAPKAEAAGHWYQASASNLDVSLFPRTYWLSSGWQNFMLIVGAALTVCGVLALLRFAAGGDTSLTTILAVFGIVLITFGAYCLAYARRFSIVLQGDSIEKRGVFNTRVLGKGDIAGRRASIARNTGRMTVLASKTPGTKPMRIESTLESDSVFRDWIATLPDLDQQELESTKAAILSDPAFGATERERADRLQRATRIAKAANLAGGAIALWGYVFPIPRVWLIPVLAAAPLLALWLVIQSKGLYNIGSSKPGNARPSLAGLFFAPGVILGVRGFLDVHVMDWRPAVLAGLVGMGLFTTLFIWRGRREVRTSIAVFTVLLVSFTGVYGAVLETDQLLDHQQAQVFQTKVLGKHVTTGKYRSWQLTLSAWGPRSTTESVTIRPDFYRSVTVGDPVCVELRPGALSIDWYDVRRC